MRTIARGVAMALMTGTLLVAVGTTASAEEGRGTGKSSNSANSGCGEYCSTRDGSPSRNGSGDGKATGRPCAGCVGKADDKNPRGQRPNGSDSNNGYECDGNKGIAKGNPAHTGCTATTATSKPAAAPAGTSARPAALAPKAPARVPVAVLGTNRPAQAGRGAQAAAGERSGEVVVPSAAITPRVLGTRLARPASGPGTLPFTGGMTIELVLAACAMVVTGVATTRLGARAGR